jgi:hypothetical protein
MDVTNLIRSTSLNSAASIEESTVEELHQRASPVVCTGETGLLFVCTY